MAQGVQFDEATARRLVRMLVEHERTPKTAGPSQYAPPVPQGGECVLLRITSATATSGLYPCVPLFWDYTDGYSDGDAAWALMPNSETPVDERRYVARRMAVKASDGKLVYAVGSADIPDASQTVAGKVNLATQTLGAGHKTFYNQVTVNGAAAASSGTPVFRVNSDLGSTPYLRCIKVTDAAGAGDAAYVVLVGNISLSFSDTLYPEYLLGTALLVNGEIGALVNSSTLGTYGARDVAGGYVCMNNTHDKIGGLAASQRAENSAGDYELALGFSGGSPWMDVADAYPQFGIRKSGGWFRFHNGATTNAPNIRVSWNGGDADGQTTTAAGLEFTSGFMTGGSFVQPNIDGGTF